MGSTNSCSALNILDILWRLGHIWGFVGCYLKIWSLISKLNSLPGFEVSWRKWNFKAERSGSGSRKPILHEQGKRWPRFQHDSRLTIQKIWKWLRTSSGNYALHCLWIKIVLNLWKLCQNAGEEVVRLSRFCFIYFFPFLVHAGGSTYRT